MLLFVFIFILGSIFGSFLNSVIWRIETGKSFLKGRSVCPHCGHLLSFKDLIPIFSFLILKGRCRYCRKKISLQYPLVEFFTGLLFLFIFLKNLDPLETIFSLLFSLFFILIFVFDLKYYSIPDNVLCLSLFLALIYRLLKILFFSSSLLETFLALLPSIFFLLLILISKETWMGWGDFEISILSGLFLGWPKILLSFFFSFLAGGIVSIFLIFFKKKEFHSKIPFAPFLIFGNLVSFFFGQKFIDFYFSLF